MFVEGGVPLDVPVESLAVTLPVTSQEALRGGNVVYKHLLASELQINPSTYHAQVGIS